MPIASFKDLVLDAGDPAAVGAFWAAALGGTSTTRDGGGVRLDGCFPLVWVDRVPEPKAVKNRVHLDLRAPSAGALVDLGATLLTDHGPWQVLADPEGNELCAFPGVAGVEAFATGGKPPGLPPNGHSVEARPAQPDENRSREQGGVVEAVCVDSADPVPLCAWWQGVLGGEIGPGSDGRPRWLHGAAGLGEVTLKFVPVDDERVVKNRMHWDVVGSVDELVAAGAAVVVERADWIVLTDPQGNEFCAFRP